METIQANARVVLDYELRDGGGQVVDASAGEESEPIIYVHGYGMLVPGLEAALIGMKPGEEKEVVVPPDAGFGDRDDELVLEVDRGDFPRPEAVTAGDEFIAEAPDGDEVVMRVLEVKPDAVVVDANHPLAGQTLHYRVKVREVRAANDDEIAAAASAFESAGYGGCTDPDHDHDHDHDHAHDHGAGGGELVQLTSGKTLKK